MPENAVVLTSSTNIYYLPDEVHILQSSKYYCVFHAISEKGGMPLQHTSFFILSLTY